MHIHSFFSSLFLLAGTVAAVAIPSQTFDHIPLSKRGPGSQPKSYEFTLTWEKHAPDGFEREMILVNGQFPGPKIELTEGDDVEVIVHNEMPMNTTVHFHGIEMRGTPWSDGMPGLSQRQILPGHSFVYKWTATQYGSYWYHAHQRAQIDDGLYGPIVIHAAKDQVKPFSLISSDPSVVEAMVRAERNVRPLVLSDFRHIESEKAWDISVEAGIEMPCYDSILVNGKGRVDCWSPEKLQSLLGPAQQQLLAIGGASGMTAKGCLPASVVAAVLSPPGSQTDLSVIPPEIFDTCTSTTGSKEVIDVKLSNCASGKWVAFDLIGAFGLFTTFFSIDGHEVIVYAVDGAYIEPQVAQVLPITNGDRYSILVYVTEAGDFPIRIASIAAIQLVAGQAVLSVKGGVTAPLKPRADPTVYITEGGQPTSPDVVIFNPASIKPHPAQPISATSDQTFKLSMQVDGAAYNWALNTTFYPMHLDNDNPLLFEPDPARHNNVTITTNYGEWVDLIFVTAQVPMPPHPIHKHGNKMFLIGQGEGPFPYETVAEAAAAMPGSFNFVDPPMGDTFATPNAATGPAWMVIRYHVNNPGAWFLHCHIESHLVGGMGVAIQDGIDAWPTVPPEYVNYS